MPVSAVLSISWSFLAASLCVVAASSIILVPSFLYCNRRRRRKREWGGVGSSEDKEQSCLEDTSTSEVTESDSHCDDALKLQSSLLSMSLGASTTPRNGSWLRSIESCQFLPRSRTNSASSSESPLHTAPPIPLATSAKSLLKPSRLTTPPNRTAPTHGSDRDVFTLMNGLSLAQPASDYPLSLSWRGRNEARPTNGFSKQQFRIKSNKNQAYGGSKHASRSIGAEDSFRKHKCGKCDVLLLFCLGASLATNTVLLVMYLQR